jgi:predicted tellurium resistance membrane protein TerC
LIGVNLVAEGLNFDIPSGYTYFAMAWSVLVELLNIRLRKNRAAKRKALEPDTAIDPGA